MIYVTVGTMYLDFPRLIGKMDEIAAKSDEEVVVQTGLGKTVPEHCTHFDFKPREEVMAIQRESRLVVCHAGIGSVMDALRAGSSLVVVPRLKRFGEHNNDHQMDLAQAVERRGWGRVVLAIEELAGLCADPPPAYEGYAPAKAALVKTVRETIIRATSSRRAG